MGIFFALSGAGSGGGRIRRGSSSEGGETRVVQERGIVSLRDLDARDDLSAPRVPCPLAEDGSSQDPVQQRLVDAVPDARVKLRG